MNNRLLVIVALVYIMAGCNTDKKEISRLNIVLFGYDSVACYYGNLEEMRDLRYGKITDSLFMDTLLTTARDREPSLIVLKPGSGASVLGNWEHLDTLFKINNINNRVIDTLTIKEQKFFNTTSIISYRNARKEPLKLFLPKDEQEQVPDSSRKALVVLILTENEVYSYDGVQVKSGRKSTYEALGLYLATKKSDRDFSVVIKPGSKSTYKSVVDILDLMTIEEIKNYKMGDLTAEEEAIMNDIVK